MSSVLNTGRSHADRGAGVRGGIYLSGCSGITRIRTVKRRERDSLFMRRLSGSDCCLGETSITSGRGMHTVGQKAVCAGGRPDPTCGGGAGARTQEVGRGGRHRWIGCILPCPAFLAVLFALSFAIQDAVGRLSASAAAEVATLCWLGIVGALALLLFKKDDSADRQFADDFALMTSCTALIFVPYGIF